MNWFLSLRCLIAVSLAPTMEGATRDLRAQGPQPSAEVPPAYRGLERLGDLRLRTHSIHGPAPLVVLVARAPASASIEERRYRQAVTEALERLLQSRGLSVFTLRAQAESEAASVIDRTVDDLSAAFEVFRQLDAFAQPQVLVGFADGAVAAARFLTLDSSQAALVALVPAKWRDTVQNSPGAPWEAVLRATAWRSRAVLVLESPCNGPLHDRWLAQGEDLRWRQVLLELPQYDGWLGLRAAPACSAQPPRSVAAMGLVLAPLVSDWVRRTVVFPE